MGTRITIGEGGFDPSKPNDNIVSTEEIPDDEIVPTAEEELADMRSTIAQQTALLAALFGTDDQATLDAEPDDDEDGDI